LAPTLAAYGVGALAAGRWRVAGAWNVYAAAAILGGLFTDAYEWRALAAGWWSKAEAMPVVPALGVGLWPLPRLALLVPAALWLATRWAGRR
jgi:hypothetical protein